LNIIGVLQTVNQQKGFVMSKLKARKPEEVTQGKAKGLLYGESGVGKTWFSLSFPSPYYIDTEGGADGKQYQRRLKDAGGAYMGPEDGSLDLSCIIQEMQTLATEKHQYKTLVIDSITKVYQTCIANEAERLGDKDVFGASKKPAIAQMRRMVNWCMKLDMNIWFIAHETSEWGKNDSTGQREEIGKIPDVWDKLIYELDLGLRIFRIGKEYPPRAYVKKTRLEGFPDREVFSLDYTEFSKRYGKDSIESETTQIVLAEEKQISEILRLISILNVSPEETEKVLTRAGASSWDELSINQADKTLEWLNKKIKGVK
jgi:RecA-family ATPase